MMSESKPLSLGRMMLVALLGSLMAAGMTGATDPTFEECAKDAKSDCTSRQRNSGHYCCDGEFYLNKCDVKVAYQCKYHKRPTCDKVNHKDDCKGKDNSQGIGMSALDMVTGDSDADVKIVVSDAIAIAVDVGADSEDTKDPTKLLSRGGGDSDDVDLKIVVADALALAVDVGDDDEVSKRKLLMEDGQCGFDDISCTANSGRGLRTASDWAMDKALMGGDDVDVKIIAADALAVAVDVGQDEEEKDPTKLMSRGGGNSDDVDVKIVLSDALAIAVDVGDEEE